MQSRWIYCFLVFFLSKSTGLAEVEGEISVLNGTDSRNFQGLDLANTYSQSLNASSAHGIYTVQIGDLDPIQDSRDIKILSPGWTVIARRTNGELNFFRDWAQYKRGFGNISGDFFIGLDKLHAITQEHPQVLYVHLEDFEGNTRYAQYDDFLIESENELYRMSKLGNYTGDAGDSLSFSKDNPFTTFDRDHDNYSGNCAVYSMGAWWYDSCTLSNLFGMYLNGYLMDSMVSKGIHWYHWRGYDYSYKLIQMMLRPKCTC